MERTRAIVLSRIAYNDHSTIVRMYSDRYGSLSFLIRGLRKPKGTCSSNLFFPLTELEIDFHYDVRKNLHSAKDIRLSQSIAKVSGDLLKQNICLFLSEVLNKALREVPSDEELYGFISKKVGLLISTEHHASDFHLDFLAELTHYLGFAPAIGSGDSAYFDLREGKFCKLSPMHSDSVEGTLCMAAQRLFTLGTGMGELEVQRSALLCLLLRYYALHIPDFGAIQSLEVLQAVWRPV